jgi:hypothetical protein
VRDGNETFIDARRSAIELCSPPEERADRLAGWLRHHPSERGVLARHGRHAVSPALGAPLE